MQKKTKIILSSTLANTFEWYDYALFGQLAPIIAVKFFPDQDINASMLQTFLLFAVGYFMRPVGGIVFGIIGDKFGRKKALSLAVISMSFPTFIIGLLPEYSKLGVFSSIIMALVRMLQGLSMGGVLTGSISFLIEHTPPSRRGFVGSLTMSSICLGILLGSVITYGFKYILSEQEFFDWGWRLPFLFGVVIMFLGLYIKKYTDETPVFLDAQNSGSLPTHPLKFVFKNHKKDILISILINATGSVIFYLQAVYVMNYLKITRNFASADVDFLLTVTYILMAILTLIIGYLSDIIDRKKIYYVNIIFIVILIYPILRTIENGTYAQIFFAQILLACMSAVYIAPEPALQAEFFPQKVRNTALSVSYNLGTAIFGGTTPYIVGYLFYTTNSIGSAAIYIIICALCSFGALLCYKRPKA